MAQRASGTAPLLEERVSFPPRTFIEHRNDLMSGIAFEKEASIAHFRNQERFYAEEEKRAASAERKADARQRRRFPQIRRLFTEQYDGTATVDLIRTFERHDETERRKKRAKEIGQ